MYIFLVFGLSVSGGLDWSAWPPRSSRSSDLSPLDFYLWGHLKAMVYPVKIRGMNKSSQGTYRQRHYKHNFNCANACSSTVKNKH